MLQTCVFSDMSSVLDLHPKVNGLKTIAPPPSSCGVTCKLQLSFFYVLDLSKVYGFKPFNYVMV
jgi:hypothetical protein